MSGHNKWSKIKRQKGKEDRRRSKMFSKLSEAISIAVKEGGGDDPDFNAQLRMEIERAKEADMPKENIQNAIDRGAGRGEFAKNETFIYEGFGPSRVAVVIKGRTDNRNRTAAEIKALFDRSGGSLGSPGSSSYLFDEKGIIQVKKNSDPEEQLLEIIDLDVEDYQDSADVIEIYTKPAKIKKIKQQLEEKGFEVEKALIDMIPQSKVTVTAAEAEKVKSFLSELREREDVERVFSNVDFSNG
jgi:YebC/PmpR family DNA-binding regulatory protein